VSFATLALVAAVAVLGPLLALPRGWSLPVVLGELLGGVLLGPTVLGVLDAGDPTFAFLADIGFALVMFVAGSHVPVRDARLRGALGIGVLRAAGVGVASAVLGVALAAAFGTGHGPLYAVLLASSSAALILPIVDSLHLGGEPVIQLLPQVAVADAACIVALPLAVDPRHAARAALGALAVLAAAGVAFLILLYVERSGLRHRIHRVSEERKFALELRINLVVLFALAALAMFAHVSLMLAGFAYGVAVAGVGEPRRRLARQLFAVTEGFFGPLFFVWLGASLDLRALGRHPALIGLGLALGAGAVLTHATMRLTGQPTVVGGLAAAQLGVPVAAATIGSQTGLLRAGEPAALLLGALLTIGVAILCGSLAARAGLVAGPSAPHTR
jgi:Kef-type K+ transport system membrane component KefB